MIGMIISFTLDSGLSGEGHGVSWGMEGLFVAIAAILLGITAWATRFLDRERIVNHPAVNGVRGLAGQAVLLERGRATPR